MDASDAFQATRVDAPDSTVPRLYTRQAQGFIKYTQAGKPYVCLINCAHQGRRDSGKLFNSNFKKILLKLLVRACLWDGECYIYHVGCLAGDATAPLKQVLLAAQDESGESTDIDGDARPHGWAALTMHVDDALRVYTSKRIKDYLNGGVAIEYAMTYSGWQKHLGFTLVVNKDERTVEKSCLPYLERLRDEYLAEEHLIQPKHVAISDQTGLDLEDLLPEHHPEAQAQRARHKRTRSLVMSLSWATAAYPQSKETVNSLCAFVARPNPLVMRHAKHVLMHLLAYPLCARWGGLECTDLTPPAGSYMLKPDDPSCTWWHLIMYVDASPVSPPVSGVVAQLAKGPVDTHAGRQHQRTSCAHTSEVSAAVTAGNHGVPLRGLCGELRLLTAEPTPIYIDSSTTVFVASDKKAVKKSTWLLRKVDALHETVGTNGQEFYPNKIDESRNLADMFTKYLKLEVWRRHVMKLLNREEWQLQK